MKNGRTKRIAYLALLATMTLILGYVETLIPLPVAIPGVKLGLGNVAVLIALYAMGPRWALATMAVKVALAWTLFGSPMMIIYSFAGSTLAFAGMIVAWRFKLCGVVAVSVIAAVLHNVGQVCAAALIMQTPLLFVNLPVLVIAACVTGVLTGSVAAGVLKALPALPSHSHDRYAASSSSQRV